jgi:cyclase
MLKKRIIPCLDIKDGRTVKGIKFKGLRDAGDPVDLARFYAEQGADELVFLDITATIEKRKTLYKMVKAVAKELDIPFTVGGGISSLDEAKRIIDCGADKISINSAAVKRPELITEIANYFGNQCVVLAIDTNIEMNEWHVCTHGGRKRTEKKTKDWAVEGEQLGAGEILLTAMTADGTKDGYDIKLNKLVSDVVSIPVIASGGAGTQEHFYEVFTKTSCTAALAASVFHFGEIPVQNLKQYLKELKIPIR